MISTSLERAAAAGVMLDIYFSRRCIGCGVPLEPYILLFPRKLIRIDVTGVDGCEFLHRAYVCHLCFDPVYARHLVAFSDSHELRRQVAAELLASGSLEGRSVRIQRAKK